MFCKKLHIIREVDSSNDPFLQLMLFFYVYVYRVIYWTLVTQFLRLIWNLEKYVL